MALLTEIQRDLLDSSIGIAPALLKLRFLADRLGSDLLEDWVRFETEGYPKDATVPDYRIAVLTYTGTFISPGWQMKDVPVPPHIIMKVAGADWLQAPIRDGLGVIDSIVEGRTADELSAYGISVAGLMPLLRGKVYEGADCINLRSRFAGSPFVQIQQTIRSKALDLTLRLEKEIPASANVSIAEKVTGFSTADGERADQIVQHFFYGPVGQVNHGGDHRTQSIQVIANDAETLKDWLVANGLSVEQSGAITEMVQREKPSKRDLEGENAWQWIKDKLGQGATGAISLGKEVARDVIIAGIKAYYGWD